MANTDRTERDTRMGPPPAQGLYDPQYEHDACGVGFICNLRGEKSHYIISHALEILVNLTHRGACGCDETTGDGAGLLLQMPHKFLRKAAGGDGIRLPDPGDYGCGLVFLPRNREEREKCMKLVRDVVEAEGQVFLGWRTLPVNNSVLGDIAGKVEPVSMHLFIGRGSGIESGRDFERKLFVIRKLIERAIRTSDLSQKKFFFITNLSAQTLTYKGMLLADQMKPYFRDLRDEDLVSGLALVHQRYSTNTFPTWDLAQPFRFLCHNGEINTLRGNINWMNAREALFQSELFGDDMKKVMPIATPEGSDSLVLDNAVELLYHTGRSLPHSIMMLIPEAWQNHKTMSARKKAFYQYHSCFMEPWDGPASIPFTDGTCIGAVLDRNGLRPSRYTVTKDGFVIMGSETGVLNVDPANVQENGRLEPGRMFLVDMEQGRIVSDEEIKEEITGRQPYGEWLDKHLVRFEDLQEPSQVFLADFDTLVTRQQAFGYSEEDLKVILAPMAGDGKEPLGSMGDDTPPAVLSSRPRLLYDYFRQLFAQVTNPPIDPFREKLVTSVQTTLGAEQDLFKETPEHCHQFELPNPILTNKQVAQIREMIVGDISSTTLDMVYEVDRGGEGLHDALERLCREAAKAVESGTSILILSDRAADHDRAGIPALLATGGVHHYLIRRGLRTQCDLVIESAEPREVHHFCVLFGYGAGAVNPYLAFETVHDLLNRGALGDITLDQAVQNYIQSISDGILKVIAKMGISTLHSYRGAQIFEALGLNDSVIDDYFTWTASRIGGIGLDEIAREVAERHHRGYPRVHIPGTSTKLDPGGKYKWRRNGEYHVFNPMTVSKLQHAIQAQSEQLYQEYADMVNTQNKDIGTLRGLMEFKTLKEPIPLEEVEPWTEIVKRFKTGAMSYGSISSEAHETLAIAMNRIGGKSNSGEGGEDPDRFTPDENGDWRNSAIKQAASGRFGVTSYYLANARELQIKMAQGAKPGEGGELPGFKVLPWIAKTRHTTPYVGLISPPPHHDIYSIEDLAQLVHDLKCANPEARVNVKLVSEVGVGTVAAGVSKGKADVVLISGHDGGTGASKQTSIKSAGLPWELGLSETHQTLALNDLRSRIVVECDGQMKTGRDVAVACLLGAEEYGFSTAPLVVMGCIMMRVCHLNTCPVGIATQDPELRKKFMGTPDGVVTYFRFVAEEIRRIMAGLGFRTMNEMVGQSDKLRMRRNVDHWKARGLDFSKILNKPQVPPHVGIYCTQKQDHGLAEALDVDLIAKARPALERGEKVEFTQRIRNIHRTVGTTLSYHISKKYGEDGLPEDTITIHARGSAGQSFCAFGARGLTVHIRGDANDYFGKGLSGARLSIRPPEGSSIVPEENILIGNVAFFGAISGEAYIRGLAGERFCVRNSGVRAVVEGVGDHGCEYMTGGRAVILGSTGRNFAAGMSGGVAYVLDEAGDFEENRCNTAMVGLEPVEQQDDIDELRHMIEQHVAYTESTVGQRILDRWDEVLPRFIKVMPHDYKRALEILAREEAEREAASSAETDEPALQNA